MNLFFHIWDVFLYSYFGLTIIGLLFYKMNNDVTSWEDGINAFLKSLRILLYYFTEKVPPEKIVDKTIILDNKEANELLKIFVNHPYETPTLLSYIPYTEKGISEYHISALGFCNHYKELTLEQLRIMTENLIQNFMMETRQKQVCLRIYSASATNLSFGIALSKEGREMLGSNILEQKKVTSPEDENKTLEETIDIFDADSEE